MIPVASSSLDCFIAVAQYPCHPQKKVRLEMYPIVPLQKFDRACPICKLNWVITCSIISRDKDTITLTRAEWERGSN